MINILKKGQKAVIGRNIPSVDGMLYADTKVTIDEIGFPDKDIRVKDDTGKIWYVDLSDIREVK
tara:strand:- start:1250 stop:1441 length:192 start_codon:yes stop_codon:yes gene_type:complete